MAPRGSPAQILVALLLRAKQLLEARGANEDAFARVRYELIVASIGFTSRLALLLKFCRTYLAIVLRTTCLKHEPTGAFPQLSIVSTNGGGDRRERWPRRRCASTNCDPHDLPHRSLTTGAGNPTPSSALNVPSRSFAQSYELSPSYSRERRCITRKKQNPADGGVLPFSAPDGGGSGGPKLSERAF
jgi:hypothetical protein